MKFLSTKQAAEKLGLHPNTLANWRWQGVGPEYRKVDYAILYCPKEIARYKKEHLQ